MNRNPVPPGERSFFRSLKSRFIRLDELEFARPGINAFDAAVELNRIFQGVKDE
jgi:iron complex transport system substrate-binding protein